MRNFDKIYAMAAARKGGPEELEKILAETRSLEPAAIARLPNDRVLAAMTRSVFSAGWSYRMVDRKWAAFETAFDRFDPHACAFMADERLETILRTGGIVRSPRKIRSVPVNARFVLDLAAEHGSAARLLAAWPDDTIIELVQLIRKRGSRLGGETAMRFLRALGKPAFVTSPDMLAALVREGVLTSPSAGKRNLALIQAAMNAWAASSGRDQTVISRVLSMSIG